MTSNQLYRRGHGAHFSSDTAHWLANLEFGLCLNQKSSYKKPTPYKKHACRAPEYSSFAYIFRNAAHAKNQLRGRGQGVMTAHCIHHVVKVRETDVCYCCREAISAELHHARGCKLSSASYKFIIMNACSKLVNSP